MMVLLSKLITPERVVLLGGVGKVEALDRLVAAVSTAPEVQDSHALSTAISDREAMKSTGIGHGIAIPHAKIASVTDIVGAIGLSKAGIDFDSIDKQPAHVLVLIAAGEKQQLEYLQMLAQVTLVLKDPNVREALLTAKDAAAAYNILSHY